MFKISQKCLKLQGSKEILSNNPNSKKYRIVISDGVHLDVNALLISKLTHMLSSGVLTENTVVKITNHVLKNIKNGDKGDR